MVGQDNIHSDPPPRRTAASPLRPADESADPPVRVFISYSHEDEQLLRDLHKHLKPLERSRLIDVWHDRHIEAGEPWQKHIEAALQEAHIVLVAVSSSFLASQYAYMVELTNAFEQQEAGLTRIIPLILRRCDWRESPLGRLQAVPRDGFPVNEWRNRDEAWSQITEEVKRTAHRIKTRLREAPPSDSSPPEKLDDLCEFADVGVFCRPRMVVLPTGSFLMGAASEDVEAWPDERPQMPVVINQRFAIGVYPVRFEEYDEFCEDESRAKPDDKGWGRERFPVINVSWHDARAYCRWLAHRTKMPYRLPSEAEWEYACRAGSTSAYWRGDNIYGQLGNFGAEVGRTTETDRYDASPWKLRDMLGNVWEWVDDAWCASFECLPTDGRPRIAEGNTTMRVVRGGCWNSRATQLRSSARLACPAEYTGKYVGFRVARTV